MWEALEMLYLKYAMGLHEAINFLSYDQTYKVVVKSKN